MSHGLVRMYDRMSGFLSAVRTDEACLLRISCVRV